MMVICCSVVPSKLNRCTFRRCYGRFPSELLSPGVTLLSHSPELIALQKSCNILSHPNERNINVSPKLDRCLFKGANYDHLAEFYTLRNSLSPKTPEDINNIWLLHRLDSSTSGLILVSPEKEVADSVKKSFSDRRVSKTYFAVVFANPKWPSKMKIGREQMWEDNMSISRKGDQLKAQTASLGSNGSNLTAKTRAKVVAVEPITSDLHLLLLQLHPITGFTHQLRYQCALRGLPIVGDKNYGNFPLNKWLRSHRTTTGGLPAPSRTYLHSHHIDLTYTIQEGQRRFAATSNVPREFFELMPGITHQFPTAIA